MKNTFLKLALGLILISVSFNSIAKGFDFSTLKNKTLYIPEYSLNDKYAKKLMKKGKFDQLETLEAKVQLYNENWNEAMAMSSYDATPYEIRTVDYTKLSKEKNEEAMLLRYGQDDYGNLSVALYVTGPKAQMVATTIINGIDLSEVSEIRLMMNMLNFALNEKMELENSGSKTNYSGTRNKYKENLVAFGENMDEKTFLITPVEHKNAEKAELKNKEIKEAAKSWNISKVDFISKEELETLRAEGDENSFYLRNFPVYSGYITYNMNVLLTTAGDEMIVGFLGAKKIKASKLDDIQAKILKKIAKFSK